MQTFNDSDVAALTAAAKAAVEHRRAVGSVSVAPSAGYPEILARFSGPLPETGTSPEGALKALLANTDGGLLRTDSPNFHGWVVGASHPAGIAADWMTSAWGQFGGVASAAPAQAAAEAAALDWLQQLLGLPKGVAGALCTGATMANFTAMAAARNALLARAGWDVEGRGLFGAPEVNVIVGGDTHASVFLSLRLLGFWAERVHVAAADAEGRMKPDALATVIEGLSGPVLVCLQAGNVNSGAFDPFGPLIDIAHDKGAWVHVDGAFGLWAAAAPAFDTLTARMADADSWAADAHKWLQVPYDCGVAFVRDKAALSRAMSVTAAYLPDSPHREPMDFSPEMSRRARGFALWTVIRALGRSGAQEMIVRHHRVAREIAETLAAHPQLKVLNDVVLNQILVACDDDRQTRAVLATLQAGGACYPTQGMWHGREVMRISVTAGPTGSNDGARTAQAIIAALEAA